MIKKIGDFFLIAAMTVFYLVSSVVLFIYVGIKGLFKK
tara:strand:- start:111 stop:224 length:114 start_codon:yes stop_codon:yes gene_type:complete